MRSVKLTTLLIEIGFILCTASGQATLSTSAGPLPLRITAPLDGPVSSVGSFVVGAVNPDRSEARVNFKLDHIGGIPAPAASNLLFFYPTSGTTPATIYFGINPSALNQSDSGGHFTIYFTTTDQSPPSVANALIDVGVTLPPAPTVTSVVNSASYQSAISPGALVTIFGSNLAPPRGSLSFDSTGLYPTSVPGSIPAILSATGAEANTTVTFNGIAAPLLYVSPGQINAVVPYEVAGQKMVSMVVTRYGPATAPFPVRLADTSPAIFTTTQSGTGQGATLNVPPNPNNPAAYTYNSTASPAVAGQAIEFFATGAGVWNVPVTNGVPGPPVIDGEVSLVAANFTAQPVSLTIGGQRARIYYAGSAPYQAWGVLQIIAFVPDGVPSGPQPIIVTIGENDNSQQNVTISIK